MKSIKSIVHNYFPFNTPPLQRSPFGQYRLLALLFFFLLATVLPSCRVKSGCASTQKNYTNNMERTKKRGKTTLFPKSVTKKIKH